MKVVMYVHGGSENHGCEAIIRSTARLLELDSKQSVLLSYNQSEDLHYGLDSVVSINQEINAINKKSFDFIKAYFMQKFFNKHYYVDALLHKLSINSINNMDFGLFVGGDNYCYSDAEVYPVVNKLIRKKVKKLVLWGTSVEPSVLEKRSIKKDIKKFDLIVARESISYDALKKVNSHTLLLPDPAFFLNIERTELPKNFIKGNTIGINISPMILEYEKNQGKTIENYEYLINYIIEQTDYNIALIPHVVWDSNDDRKVLRMLYDKISRKDRICIVDDHNCMQQKYIISQCSYFIGARTHATIAAYSTCVPTLVVGYSVKAKGIAKDLLGTYENYVIPVQELKEQSDLLNSFLWLRKNSERIKNELKNKTKEYSALKNEYLKGLVND